ncbi:MAG: tetratricopeptide repeat protein, partial [Deltaproteobacteria bacterium]|nr:tetratricopeptide repeat protein [Deltaproteobacteria bacterium]
DKAISAYKEAISINDNTAWAHYNLAKVYYDKMQYQLAIKHCDRSIILGYNVPIRFLNLIKPYLN